MKTDLQKFKDFFDEIGIEYGIDTTPRSYCVCKYDNFGYYHEDEYTTDVIRLWVGNSHLQYNYGAGIDIIFNADDERFIVFESWGE